MTAKSNGDAIDEATRLLAPAETSPATKTFAGLGESREEERNNGYASYGTQLPETGDEESQVVVVLLIGMFVSNADGSLVMATHPLIASEFNDLEDSSWLFISFSLAGAATQGLYAKLSDIFGRRSVLVSAYALFAIGCAIVGIGQAMWQVILGRVISGSGGAGLSVVVAVAITDLVPLREVASWNSYMNLVSTVGRSLGGPLGGFLADTIGWRWSFLGQVPFFILALVLCILIMPNIKTSKNVDSEATRKSQVARIDFLGALLLGLAILGFMVPLEFAGQNIPWNHPIIFILFGLGVLFLSLFILVEDRYAKEPIFPLKLLRNRDVVAAYIVTFGQTAAQVSMMFTVPLYFQISQRASATVAGAHLFPAVAGNAVGSILTGIFIKRTGKYKPLVVIAALLGASCYILLYFRWNGNTDWWESMYIVPGGFASGIAQTSIFISLQASINPEDKAAASAGMFLTWPVGIMTALAISKAVMQATIKSSLGRQLLELGLDEATRDNIVRQAVASVDYVYKTKGAIGEAVVRSYIDGLSNSHLVSLAFVLLALVSALTLRQYKL